MEDSHKWSLSSKMFFDLRALAISRALLDRTALCFVSGKDPRLWIDDTMYDDLILSIVTGLDLRLDSDLLELGCAAGLLAVGLATKCRTYTGIDVSPRAISVARRLRLPNARFEVADAVRLPYPDNSFDRVLCYDVFNNFPNFLFGKKVIEEGLRVVKPGGFVCIGALPDTEKRDADDAAWQRMQKEKTESYGPQEDFWPKENWYYRILKKALLWKGITPHITCYYFRREDFITFGDSHGLDTTIIPLHSLSPYRDTRFSVIYKKPV